MSILSAQQIDAFQRDGVLVVPDALSTAALAACQAQFSAWVEESRAHPEAWGDTLDGRPRFDLQPGHSAEQPALRRVQAPTEISRAYLDAMAQSRIPQMVADLIGPDVKHHHNKINSKLPGSGTEVKWHQDFPFTPHSNADIVTALLMVDEITEENGPLEVVPGTHTGELMPIWHDGVFTGAVADDTAADLASRSRLCTGAAGSVCLMHTRLAHGSTANRSSAPRTLFICVYSAADAVPLSPNPVPNRHEGLMVAGENHGRIRSEPFEIEQPEYPKQVSFFSQQSESERRAP